MSGARGAAAVRSRTFRFPALAGGEAGRERADPRQARRVAALAGAGVMGVLALAGAFEPSRAGVIAFWAGCAAAGGNRVRGAGALVGAGGVAVAAFYATLVAVDAASHVWGWLTAR